MTLLFILSALLGFSLIVLSHYLRKYRRISRETARKLVHIAHAFVVSGWPAFFGYTFVILGELLFVLVVLIAQEYRIFHDLKQVDRKTWGEFFLPLGVIWLALITPPIWVFVSCLLLLGLSDGIAAIVGQRVKSKRYKVFGQKKSVGGTVAFVMSACLIMTCVVLFSDISMSTQQILGVTIAVPILTAFAENVSPFGSDNISILVVAYVALDYLGIFV